MRACLVALALGIAGAAFLPASDAQAWWDRWGRWHPGYVGPRVVVGPPPVVVVPPPAYAPVVRRPYAVWIRPHYDRFGRFIPGHWG